MSKLSAPQLRDTFLSWKGVVGGLVPVYYTGHKMKNDEIWIMSDISFSSFLLEAAAMEAIWWRNYTGTGLAWLGGGPSCSRPYIGTLSGCLVPPHYLTVGTHTLLQQAPDQWRRWSPPLCGSEFLPLVMMTPLRHLASTVARIRMGSLYIRSSRSRATLVHKADHIIQ